MPVPPASCKLNVGSMPPLCHRGEQKYRSVRNVADGRKSSSLVQHDSIHARAPMLQAAIKSCSTSRRRLRIVLIIGHQRPGIAAHLSCRRWRKATGGGIRRAACLAYTMEAA